MILQRLLFALLLTGPLLLAGCSGSPATATVPETILGRTPESWAAGLMSADADVRRTTREALKHAPVEEAVPMLIYLGARESDNNLRIQYSEVIHSLGTDALEELVRTAEDPHAVSMSARISAAWALTRFGSEAAPYLDRIIDVVPKQETDGPSSNLRRALLTALMEMGPEIAGPRVGRFLSGNRMLREATADVYREWGIASIPLLEDAINQVEDESQIARMRTLQSEIRAWKIPDDWMSLPEEPGLPIRMERPVVDAVGISQIIAQEMGIDEMTAGGALIELMERIESPREPGEVRQAMRSLSLYGQAAAPAVDSLISRLRDEDAHTRWAAMEALGEIGPYASPAVPELERILSESGNMDALRASWTLLHIGRGARSAAPLVLDALVVSSTDLDLHLHPDIYRFSMLLALANIDSATGVHRFAELLRSPRWTLRAEGALALVIGGAECLPALGEGLNDPDPRVRNGCAWALLLAGSDDVSALLMLTMGGSEDRQTPFTRAVIAEAESILDRLEAADQANAL